MASPHDRGAAIAQYIVTNYGPSPLEVGVDEPAYGAYLNWLHFGEATLTFPQTLVLRYTEMEPEERRKPQVAADYAKWFLGRLRAIERFIGNSETLCAGRFTAADIRSASRCCWRRFGFSPQFGPAVTAYWPRLKQRDGYLRAVAAETLAGEQQKVARRGLKADSTRRANAAEDLSIYRYLSR